jgi:hypothetical protein
MAPPRSRCRSPPPAFEAPVDPHRPHVPDHVRRARDTSVSFVFPTSTGEEGFETSDQDRTPVFRFNPASTTAAGTTARCTPVEADNPLNGNMYKPLYFDRGQAIHGASNVPTSPASKGCARLRVENQDMLVEWLGLADRDASGRTCTERFEPTGRVISALHEAHRRLFRPIGRMALLVLLWEHRRSVNMACGRSATSSSPLADGLRPGGGRRSGTVKSVIVDDANHTVALATTPSGNPSTPPTTVNVADATDDQLRYTGVS